MLIRIQIRIDLNVDPDTGSRVLMKKSAVNIFLSEISINLSLGLYKGCLSHRRNLQLSKENIHHFKTKNFFIFSILWAIFVQLDPDPADKINADP
jgi:hypothetical protein